MAEENIISEIIESFWWREFTGAEGVRFARQGDAERQALARALSDRLSTEIRMQIHEWYWEEMSDIFPIEDLEPLVRRLVGVAAKSGEHA